MEVSCLLGAFYWFIFLWICTVGCTSSLKFSGKMWDKVWDSIWYPVPHRIQDWVWNYLWREVWTEICRQGKKFTNLQILNKQIMVLVWDKVWATMWDKVWDHLWAAVSDNIWGEFSLTGRIPARSFSLFFIQQQCETKYEQQCSTTYEEVCEEAQPSYNSYGAPSAYGAPKQCKQVKSS